MSPPITNLDTGITTPLDFDAHVLVADLCDAIGQNDSLSQGKDSFKNARYIASSLTLGLGTDEKQVFDTLRKIKNQAQMSEVEDVFIKNTGLSLKESLTRDLSAGELGTALGLIEFWSADTEPNREKFTLSRSEKEATTQKIKNIETGWNLAYGVTGAVVALAASSAVLATAPLSVPLAIGAIAAGTAAGFTAESLVMTGGNAIRGKETTKEDYVDALGTAFTSSLGLGIGRGVMFAFEKSGTKLAQALVKKGMTQASAGKTAEIFSRYGGAITTNEAIGYANTGILEHRIASKEEAALWGIFGLATGAIRPWMNVNRTREISAGMIQETAENEVETLCIRDRDGDGLADGAIRTEDHIAALQGAFTELGGHIRQKSSPQDRDGDGVADGDIRTEDHVAGLQGAFTELDGHIRQKSSPTTADPHWVPPDSLIGMIPYDQPKVIHEDGLTLIGEIPIDEGGKLFVVKAVPGFDQNLVGKLFIFCPFFFTMALGSQVGEFFGYKTLDLQTYLIPNAGLLNQRIHAYNSLNLGQKPIDVNFYTPETPVVPNDIYLDRFREDMSLPIGEGVAVILHDSFHVTGIAVPKPLMEIVRRGSLLQEAVTSTIPNLPSWPCEIAEIVDGVSSVAGYIVNPVLGYAKRIAEMAYDFARPDLGAFDNFKRHIIESGQENLWQPFLPQIEDLVRQYPLLNEPTGPVPPKPLAEIRERILEIQRTVAQSRSGL